MRSLWRCADGACYATHAGIGLLLLAAAFWTQRAWADDSGATANASRAVAKPDACVVEFRLPAAATVTIDGQDYGRKRQLVYQPLEPGKTYASKAEIRYPGGQSESHTLLLEGGRTVRLLSAGPKIAQTGIEIQSKQTSSITAFAFSPDRRMLAISGFRNPVTLWDLATGRRLRTFRGHRDAADQIVFSPDGRMLLTATSGGTGDKEAVLWDVVTGKVLQKFPVKQSYAVGFDASGGQVFSYAFRQKTYWDVTTGQQLRAFEPPHRFDYWGDKLSRDGRWMWLVGKDRSSHTLWDLAAEKPVQTFADKFDIIEQLAVSPDGSTLAVAGRDHKVVVLDIATGQQRWTSEHHQQDLYGLTFSRDGSKLVSVSNDKSAVMLDAATGRRLQTFICGEAVRGVEFDPSGRPEMMTVDEQGVTWWNTTSGGKIREMPLRELSSAQIAKVGFNPNGRQAMVVGDGAFLWDAASARRLPGLSGNGLTFAFDLSGKRVFLGDRDGVLICDAATGRKLGGMSGYSGYVSRLKLSRDGKRLLGSSPGGPIMLWDVATGRKLQTFQRSKDGMDCEAISPDNRYVIGGTGEKEVTLWDAVTGEKIRTFDGRDRFYPATISFSPDGQKALIAHQLWDVATGQMLQKFDGHADYAQFSPDGRYVVVDDYVVGAGKSTFGVALWDVATGQKARQFIRYWNWVTCVGFRGDGRQILLGSDDDEVSLWDVESGGLLRTFPGHGGTVNSVAMSPDGLLAATGAEDGCRLWNVATGQQLASLISLPMPSWRSGENDLWLIVTPEGLFDGSAAARQQITFRIGGGLNLVPVDRFFQDFFCPGLLASVFQDNRPLPQVELGQSLPPKIRILSPKESGLVDDAQAIMEVEVTDQGGGISGPWLLQNGARVLTPGKPQREGDSVHRRFPVSLVQGENRVEVRAASADGSWESEPAVLVLRYEQSLPKPELYVVAVGVNRYAEDAMTLKYARADAQSIAEVFQQRGATLFGQVHAVSLLDEKATRSAILKTIAGVSRQARPQDVLVVFLAGHGTIVDQRYYFLPHEFRRQSDKLAEDVGRQGLAATELGEALAAVPALKRVLVFDTGQSGAALRPARTARNPFAFRGAIERLSRAEGAFTIATAAVSDQAQELPALGHGVLTYTLLAGLAAVDGGPLQGQSIQTVNTDHVAHVLQWFGFASAHVPELTREFFGQPQDVQHSSAGTSFPVLPVAASKEPARPVAPLVTAQSSPKPLPVEVQPERPSLKGPRDPPGAATVANQSKLHLVAIGINRYQEAAINLKFARNDAQAVAELFRRRGGAAYGEVQVKVLLDQRATKAGILAALEQVADVAGKQDTLVVFVAGHATMVGQRYYFIPHEFRRQAETLKDDIGQQGLPADMIGDALAKVPALKRILVFDTCASGGALGLSRQARDPLAFAGAIQRLSQHQGTFTIAASSAGEEAQEIDALGHGVLTYSLLAGLRAVDSGPLKDQGIAPNNRQGIADVLEWFNFAAEQVPRLTRRYLGREQDVQTSGQGTAFLVLPARGEVVGVAASSPETAEQAIPQDTGVVELELPAEAEVTVQGQDYGTMRKFTFRRLAPGGLQAISVKIHFADGKEEERTVDVEGGRMVRLVIAGPRRNQPEMIIPVADVGGCSSVAYSRDGRYVLTISMLDVCIWDAATGRLLRSIETGLRIVAAVFHPDGRQIVLGGGDALGRQNVGEISFWDFASGRKLRSFRTEDGVVGKMALSPEGRYAATTQFQGQKAFLWDVAKGQKLRTFWGHSQHIDGLAYNPNGGEPGQIATTSQDGTVIVWDAATERKLHVLRNDGGSTFAQGIAFNPDPKATEQLVTVSGQDNKAHLWNLVTGQRTRSISTGLKVHGLALSPDGRRLITDAGEYGGANNAISIWDLASGQKLRSLPGHKSVQGALAFSPDGRQVLTTMDSVAEASTVAWDVETGRQVQTYRGRTDMSMILDTRRDGRIFMAATMDGTIRLWDMAAGAPSRVFHLEDSDYVLPRSIAISPDGRYVAAGGGRQTKSPQTGWVVVWDTTSGQQVARLAGHPAHVQCVSFSPDPAAPRQLLTASNQPSADLWDIASGEKIRSFGRGLGNVQQAIFSPDGQYVLTDGADYAQKKNQLVLWSAATGKEVKEFLVPTATVTFIKFSPDGRRLAVGSSEWSTHKNELILWDVASGNKLHVLESTLPVIATSFSPDSKRLLSGAGDLANPQTAVWDVETGQKVRTVSGVFGQRFTPDGRFTFGFWTDASIRLSDAASGQELIRLYGLDKGKEWLAVTPEGLFDGSEGGRKAIFFRVGHELDVVGSERFHQQYYHPGLLAEIWKGQRPLPKP